MHEWIITSEGQSLAQLVTAQEALGNTVLQQDADNSRVLVETVSGGSGLANALVYKGATDCSGNPNYPAADAGHLYIVSVAGKIGGASGISVEAGDSFICKTDGTAAGTQAQRGSAWNVVQGNLAGVIVDGTGAGGVLSGTYPNPGFAVNMATQAELDAAVATIPVKASGAEVDTGADDAKFVTALALTNSDYIKEADLPVGGITNSAGANVVPKSDGTNLVASRITDPGAGGDMIIGDAGFDKIFIGNTNGAAQLMIDPDNGQVNLLVASFSVENGAIFTGDGLSPMIEGVGTIGGLADPFSSIFLGPAQITTIQIHPGTPTAARVATFPDATGTIMLSSLARLDPVAFAALPASPAEGMMAWVNDSNTAVWGATVAAGGTDKVLVVYNGTNWTVAGK